MGGGTADIDSLIFFSFPFLFRWQRWRVQCRTCTWRSHQLKGHRGSGLPTPGVERPGTAPSGGSTWVWRTLRTGCWAPLSWAGWPRAKFSGARGMTGVRRPDGRNRKVVCGATKSISLLNLSSLITTLTMYLSIKALMGKKSHYLGCIDQNLSQASSFCVK